jgi:hypothetical protein
MSKNQDPEAAETVQTINDQAVDPAAICSASWTHEGPTEDGVYLKKFDRYDDDDEAETYHVRDGKTYAPDGEEWCCFGGIWKRIGDLPNSK